MGVPVVYRKKSPTSLTNYDFMDLADGAGVVTLYGAIDANGGGVLSGGYLTRSTPYADAITSGKTSYGMSGSYFAYINKNFDLPINKPISTKGTCVFSIPVFVWGT